MKPEVRIDRLGGHRLGLRGIYQSRPTFLGSSMVMGDKTRRGYANFSVPDGYVLKPSRLCE
jgi:hypothetical protein